MILRSVKWLLITLAIIVVLLVVSVATITVMAVQKAPLVASTAPTQLDGADSVNELLAQLQQAFSRPVLPGEFPATSWKAALSTAPPLGSLCRTRCTHPLGRALRRRAGR